MLLNADYIVVPEQIKEEQTKLLLTFWMFIVASLMCEVEVSLDELLPFSIDLCRYLSSIKNQHGLGLSGFFFFLFFSSFFFGVTIPSSELASPQTSDTS